MRNLTTEELVNLPRMKEKVLCENEALGTCLTKEYDKTHKESIEKFLKDNNCFFFRQLLNISAIEYMFQDEHIIRIYTNSNKIIIYKLLDEIDLSRADIKFNGNVTHGNQIQNIFSLIS